MPTFRNHNDIDRPRQPSKRGKRRSAYNARRNPYSQRNRAISGSQTNPVSANRDATPEHDVRQKANAERIRAIFPQAVIEACANADETSLGGWLKMDITSLTTKASLAFSLTSDLAREVTLIKIKVAGPYAVMHHLLNQAGIAPDKCWWLWQVMKAQPPGAGDLSFADVWATPEQACEVASLALARSNQSGLMALASG